MFDANSDGHDTIQSDEGDDTIEGGQGRDVFVFSHGVDWLDDFDDLSGNTMTLRDVLLSDLDSSDFLF